MGVHGLWELLAPVGRRVSVETLTGRRLAIDASIWMIQFMKAMRDDRGEMVRNAHVLGFFRRICKLLFLRTKPVFVFDGGTPALKRRTVIARRRQRENAQAKVRKMAEKLLLNHLKSLRVKELAKDLENQRKKNDAKGKMVVNEHFMEANTSQRTSNSDNHNQESIDELLAASLLAEEDDGSFSPAKLSTSTEEVNVDEEEEEEEMVLPTIHGKLDPSVLAALPPSMQLDLLVQMRERLMAENRLKYQKVKKAPTKFSELQIQAYLKTVAFRREIDEVRKSAAGRGIGGVQTSRIASEANREFIFSSSFSGDKEALTSGAVEEICYQQPQPSEGPSANPVDGGVAYNNESNVASESSAFDPSEISENDLGTYLDERGRIRVSRVRAMGIRMTRDLQRNLDLMKEIEKERMVTGKSGNSEIFTSTSSLEYSSELPSKIQQETVDHLNNKKVIDDGCKDSSPRIGKSIEISFEDDVGINCAEDDELFAQLVSEDPSMTFSDNIVMKAQPSDSALDSQGKEIIFEEKENYTSCSHKEKSKTAFSETGTSDESEVEWVEGIPAPELHKQVDSLLPVRSENVSRGILQEEADLQEAIRRSIEDLGHSECSAELIKKNEYVTAMEIHQDKATAEEETELENAFQPNKLSYEVSDGVSQIGDLEKMNVSCTDGFRERQLEKSTLPKPKHNEVLLNNMSGKYLNSPSECARKDVNETVGQHKGMEYVEEKEIHEQRQLVYTCKTNALVTASDDLFSEIINSSYSRSADTPVILGGSQYCELEDETGEYLSEKTTKIESSMKDLMKDVNPMKENDIGKCSNRVEEAVFQSASMNNEMEKIEAIEASLGEEMLNLDEERLNLGNEQKRLERNAESVSSEMFAECQELLQMFGLPYIVAPMEAEAQCAYLESSGLVDGVVTDDSDVFLFGAKNVYKNIFDDRKYVETYFMKDIESELGLSREKLIRMALLLGSDYTEGVSGIGIVNAIEVVNAFPEEDGFQKFREWIESPDPSILGKTDLQGGSSMRKRRSSDGDTDVGCLDRNKNGLSTSDQSPSQSIDQAQITKQNFMDKHRNVSKNWHIPSSFPSQAVVSAYTSPQVDKSTELFSWGKPDHFMLRKLCWEKFGYSAQKADELLIPVLKEYNKHETQLRLEAFYSFNERFAKIRSKRVKDAVKGITGKKILEVMDDSVVEAPKKKKKKATLDDTVDVISETPSNITLHDVARDGTSDPLIQVEGKLKANRGSNKKGRSRQRGQSVQKRRMEQSEFDLAVTSSDENNDFEKDQAENFKELHQVRRSSRPRKLVKYTIDDLEIDNINEEQVHGDSVYSNPVEEVSPKNHVKVVDAFDYSKMNQHNVGAPSSDGLPENDSELGDEVYEYENEQETERDEVEKQNDHTLSEGDKDYLQYGGGFCDEEEKNPHENASSLDRLDSTEKCDPTFDPISIEEPEPQSVSSPETTKEGFQHKPSLSDSNQNGRNSDIITVDKSCNIAIAKDNAEDECGSSSVKLSAMPFLRRRRRK